MPDEVSIDYHLGQHGWSQITLAVGAISTLVGPFGYCSDALGDLVRAALMVAASGWRAEVVFDGEPREWRLIVGAYADVDPPKWTDFRLRVFDNSLAPGEDKIFEASCSPDSFVAAVLRAGQSVWDEYGADGYDKLWGGPNGFPLRALSALKTAISIHEPRTGWALPANGSSSMQNS